MLTFCREEYQQPRHDERDASTQTWTAPPSPPSSDENERAQLADIHTRKGASEEAAAHVSKTQCSQASEHALDQNADDEAVEASNHSPRKLSQESYIALRSKLQQMAQLRLEAQERRSLWKHEGENIRNLQVQIAHDIHKLVENMRNKLAHLWTDSLKENDLTDWEDCLIEIVDSTHESEKASKKLDSELNTLEDLEHNLRGFENELYNQGANFDKCSNLQPVRNASQSNKTGDAPNHDQQGVDANDESNSSSPKVQEGSTADTWDGYEELDLDSEGSLDAASQVEFKLQLPPVQIDLSQETNEDTLENIGFQFIDFSEVIPDPNEITGVASNGASDGLPAITEGDIDSFNRWLFYGTPWNPKWAISQDSLSATLSNLQFVKKWLARTLQTISSGNFALPHLGTGENRNSISVLRKNVRNWMWDPASAVSTITLNNVRRIARKDRFRQVPFEMEYVDLGNRPPRGVSSVDQPRRNPGKEEAVPTADLTTILDRSHDHSNQFPVAQADIRSDVVEADQSSPQVLARSASEKQFRQTPQQNAAEQGSRPRRPSSLKFTRGAS